MVESILIKVRRFAHRLRASKLRGMARDTRGRPLVCESLEPRRLLDIGLGQGLPGQLLDQPPEVTGVLVRGTNWTSQFLDYLDSHRYGQSPMTHLGYRVPGESDQLKPLSWANINTIAIVFSKDVIVHENDLQLYGIHVSDYGAAVGFVPGSFRYDNVHFVASWKFQQPIGADRLVLRLSGQPGGISDAAGRLLDGQRQNGVRRGNSGDGLPGGDFEFRFDVLPGDGSQDGTLQLDDALGLRAHLFKRLPDPKYAPQFDFDGDGAVGVQDVLTFYDSLGHELPAAEPQLPPHPAVLLGTPGDDVLSVTAIGDHSLAYSLNGGPTITLNDVSSFRFDGGDGNDQMLVNAGAGTPFPLGGLTYNGGSDRGLPGDSLSVISSGSQVVYTPAAVSGSGTLAVGGRAITFSGLEPIDVTNPGGNVTVKLQLGLNDNIRIENGFDLATGTLPAIVVSDGSFPAGSASPPAAFERLHVRNCTNLIIDTTLNDGNDTLNINSASGVASNITNLTIATGVGADVVNVNGAVALPGTLNILTQQINFAGGAVTTTGDQIYNAPVTLGADMMLTGENVTFQQTVNSQASKRWTLAVNAPGVTWFKGDVGTATNAQLGSLITDWQNQPNEKTLLGGLNPTVTIDTQPDLTVGHTTSGEQTYHDDVELRADTTATVVASGATAHATVSGGVVTGIVLDSGGSDYVSPPTVKIIGGSGSGAAAHATVSGGVVTGIVLDSGGSDYTSPPTVTIVGGGGSGATAHATIFGVPVGGIVLDSGGSDYTSPPTVKIVGGSGSGAAAHATISSGGVVTGIVLDNPGSGYISPPAVTLISVSANVTFARTVNSEGSKRWTLALNVPGTTTFRGVVGAAPDRELGALTTDAPGETDINGETVTTSGGQTYNDAVVLGAHTTLSGTFVRFEKTSDRDPLGQWDLTVNAQPGTTMIIGPVNAAAVVLNGGDVVFNEAVGGGSSGAIGILTVNGGGSVDLNNNVTTGDWQLYNVPVFLTADVTTRSTANGTIAFDRTLDSISSTPWKLEVQTGGTTFFGSDVGSVHPLGSLITDAPGETDINGETVTTQPDLTVGHVTNGEQTYDDHVVLTADTTLTAVATSGATAHATISGGPVSGIVLDNSGSGYTSPPNVTIVGGGGSGATAAATLTNGVVTDIVITNPGSGYISPPTVTIVGGGGGGATAHAIIAGGPVSDIVLDGGGSGYVSPPTVKIVGGSGAGATATATVTNGVVTGIAITSPGSGYTSPTTVTLIRVDPSVTFAKTVDSFNVPHNLTVNAGGITNFGAAVGGIAPHLNALTVTTGGPLSIKSNVTTVKDISLVATTDNLTVRPNVVTSTSGKIVLGAGDSVNLSANSQILAPNGTVTLQIGSHDGKGGGDVAGKIQTNGSQVQVNGGAGDDTLAVHLQTASLPTQGLRFNGGDGNNTLIVEGTNGLDVFCILDGSIGKVLHTTEWAAYNTPVPPTTDVVIEYASVQTVRVDTLGSNGASSANDGDRVTFQMTPLVSTNIIVDGGPSSADADGKRLGFRIIGTPGNDTVVVGSLGYPARFQVQKVQILQVFGEAGNDTIIHRTSTAVPSLLDGGDGNDRILGGSAVDVIFGGRGADWLYGNDGNDYLFADHDFEYYKPPFPAKPQPVDPADSGDYVNGGKGFDTIVALGTDIVDGGGDANNYLIVKGSQLTVYDWLRARFAAPSSSTIDPVIDAVLSLPWVKPFPACPKLGP
jgi:hypothetical protein